VNVAPAAGRLRTSTRPPCPSAIAFTIASPRPAPLAVAARSPAEAIEQAPLLVRGYARAVVAHPDARLARLELGPDRDRLLVAGVADRILGQLHQRLGEPLPVGDDRPLAALVQQPGPRERARLRVQLTGER
jgi:hypothetical protein